MQVAMLALYQLNNEKNVFILGAVEMAQLVECLLCMIRTWAVVVCICNFRAVVWQTGWYLGHNDQPDQWKDAGIGREPATKVQHTHVHKTFFKEKKYLFLRVHKNVLPFTLVARWKLLYSRYNAELEVKILLSMWQTHKHSMSFYNSSWHILLLLDFSS